KQITVGNKENTPEISKSGFVLLEHVSDNISKKTFTVYLNRKAKEGVKVSVFYPSGETKKLETDDKVTIRFSTDEEGVYFVEAITFHKHMEGKTKSDSYQSLWRCATQKFEI